MKNYKYLQAPNLKSEPLDGLSVFLAGSISGTRTNWQNEAKNRLIDHANVINPRRDYGFDNLAQPNEDLNQIEWEHRELRNADVLMFWFSWETVAPITLFEYGYWLSEGSKPIIVGIDPLYPRLRDVILQTHLHKEEMGKNIKFDLSQTIEETIKVVRSLDVEKVEEVGR